MQIIMVIPLPLISRFIFFPTIHFPSHRLPLTSCCTLHAAMHANTLAKDRWCAIYHWQNQTSSSIEVQRREGDSQIKDLLLLLFITYNLFFMSQCFVFIWFLLWYQWMFYLVITGNLTLSIFEIIYLNVKTGNYLSCISFLCMFTY